VVCSVTAIKHVPPWILGENLAFNHIWSWWMPCVRAARRQKVSLGLAKRERMQRRENQL